MTLVSPTSREPLSADTAHSLADGTGERWPVIDGIAYLRTGRATLVARALACLDADDRDGALVILLADQDDWWTGPAADPDHLRILVRQADGLSFRAAMEHLGFGRVGDYFAHRWSDPTYLAGLALMEAHWSAPSTAFELGCGAGHYLRELARRGVGCTGGDVVFAKLWLARHWVVGRDVDLVCFDAASPWPIAGRSFDLVCCHDALYFLEPKDEIVARLEAALSPGGALAVAHVHNSAYLNFSAAAAVDAARLAGLFPEATVYDDAELTHALIESRVPRPHHWAELAAVEAFSVFKGASVEPRALIGGLALPVTGTALRRNPLYGDDDRVTWPSPRYGDEYGGRATYPLRASEAGSDPQRLARTRELVDLPERW